MILHFEAVHDDESNYYKMGQHQGYYSFRESTENKSDLGLRTKYTDQFSGRRDL